MFTELEEQRVVRAIANAERDNRGEVQVRVERHCAGDALTRAKALYELAGLEGTADDTAVHREREPRGGRVLGRGSAHALRGELLAGRAQSTS